MKVGKGELIHHKLQAILREHNMPPDQIMYLGERGGDHWYLIDGKHEVPAQDIEGVDQVEDDARV